MPRIFVNHLKCKMGAARQWFMDVPLCIPRKLHYPDIIYYFCTYNPSSSSFFLRFCGWLYDSCHWQNFEGFILSSQGFLSWFWGEFQLSWVWIRLWWLWNIPPHHEQLWAVLAFLTGADFVFIEDLSQLLLRPHISHLCKNHWHMDLKEDNILICWKIEAERELGVSRLMHERSGEIAGVRLFLCLEEQDIARYPVSLESPDFEMGFSYILPSFSLPSGVKPCLPAVETQSLVPNKIYFSIAGHLKALMDSMRQKEGAKGQKQKKK